MCNDKQCDDAYPGIITCQDNKLFEFIRQDRSRYIIPGLFFKSKLLTDIPSLTRISAIEVYIKKDGLKALTYFNFNFIKARKLLDKDKNIELLNCESRNFINVDDKIIHNHTNEACYLYKDKFIIFISNSLYKSNKKTNRSIMDEECEEVDIFYNPDLSSRFIKKHINEISNILGECTIKRKDKSNKSSYVSMIIKDRLGQYDIESIDITKSRGDSRYFDIIHGKGFMDFHHQLIDKIINTNKGLVLIHGKYGTGKSYYIRYLIYSLNLENVAILMVASDMFNLFTDPIFITLLMQYLKKTNADKLVVLVEDAEDLLRSRNGENTADTFATSKLLNFSDGIYNDILGITIICTYNTDTKDIDDALLRPQRLIAKKEFKPMDKKSAIAWCRKMGIDKEKLQDKPEYTIAELAEYTDANITLTHELKKEKEPVGFKIKSNAK